MRIFLVLFLLSIPMASFAQRVTVRSGEHVDFSRLAFEFTNPVEWEMGRVEDGYEIRLYGVDAEIDISKVFSRISHDRIKSLSVLDNKSIALVLGCECHADAFEFRPGLLVVDVKDGQPLATSRFEANFNSGELTAGQHEGLAETNDGADRSADNTEGNPPIALPLSLPIAQNPTKPRIGLFGANSVEELQEPTLQVADMQSEILQQIGRAASQGLLDADISRPKHTEQQTQEATDDIVQNPIVPITVPHNNIHIQNSVDREFSIFSNQNLMTENGSKCLPDSLFNIAEWGNEEKIFARVSEQRGLILGEFDNVNADAVKQLVKAYIYAGFGTEALSALSSFDMKLEEESTLAEMAQIVDGVNSGQHSELVDQLGCDSESALWAALSAPTIPNQAPINRTSILGAFSGLPLHLRRLLGPSLAEKFLEIGDVETARSIRNSIARASGDAGSEFHLLDAKLDIERGLKESAENTLEEIIVNSKEIAPRALIELLEVRLQKKAGIDPLILATAETYIFEQQDSKIAADLKRLVALLLGQSGDFIKALDALNQMETYEHIDEKQKVATWGVVIEDLAINASEETLLEFVFSAQDELRDRDISREVRRKLAIRLLKEGWPVEAKMALLAPSAPTADDRVILAHVEYLIGKPENILIMLENVAGDEAAEIRALAYEKMERYLDAAQEYKLLKDVGNQKAAIWRAEDWAQLAVIGSETDRAAANVMLLPGHNDDEAGTITNRTLAHDSSLLMRSEEERQSIEQLLKEYPVLAQEGS